MPIDPETPFRLKNIYTRDLLSGYATELQAVWEKFPIDRFLNTVFDANWEELELKERTRSISAALMKALPDDYAGALEILVQATQEKISQEGEQMHFQLGFIADFVEKYGVSYPDLSIPAMAIITQRTSAEFAVRPFLLHYPERMYAQMIEWSLHPSYCVRRLSTEGFRPRLPWGMGIPILKKQPQVILPVLENLKSDPHESVRRSVANNLNDISKDHPELVLEIAQRWKGVSSETDAIVRHACRTLLKQAHPVALALFGFETFQVACSVEALDCPSNLKIGEKLHFSFSLHNLSAEPLNLRLEYAIHYLTSTGKISRKVFRIKEYELAGSANDFIQRSQRFQDFTTRKHYPGTHILEILVNGKVLATRTLELYR